MRHSFQHNFSRYDVDKLLGGFSAHHGGLIRDDPTQGGKAVTRDMT